MATGLDAPPVHTVYWPADRFDAQTRDGIAQDARAMLREHAPGPEPLARALGEPGGRAPQRGWAIDARTFAEDPDRLRAQAPDVWLAHAVYERVQAALARGPVEDLRVDFEDGYGQRDDATEDAHADQAAQAWRGQAMACAGIRTKALAPGTEPRARRTLTRVADGLSKAGAWPDTFVLTLPKVTDPAQAERGATLLDDLERTHGRPAGSLRLEVMVETTESLVAADGTNPLPAIVRAGGARLRGVHLGVYDFTSASLVPPAGQAPDHPMCALARGLMRLAVGDAVALSDGASNVVVSGPTAAVHRAWQAAHAHVMGSLRAGFGQGWDMNAGQVLMRHAATARFFLADFHALAARVRALVEQATRASAAQTVAGDVLDEPATAAALFRHVRRAWQVGAVREAEVAATGLAPRQLAAPSWTAALAVG